MKENFIEKGGVGAGRENREEFDAKYEGVSDIQTTSQDGRILVAPLYEGGRVGKYEESGYDTNVENMAAVMNELRARFGVPSVPEGE